MKKLTLIFAVAMIALTSKTFAQDRQEATETASSTATVITPISLTNVSGINFGTIAVDATAPGTVIIASDATYSTTGLVTVTAETTPAPATFTVSGQDTYAYNIVLPTTDIILSDEATTANTMILNAITSNASGSTGTGAETFNVGGTLNVAGGQTAGTYTNADELSVTVYYN